LVCIGVQLIVSQAWHILRTVERKGDDEEIGILNMKDGWRAIL